MSFSLTTAQMRARTKTVTRRLGWLFLEPGDLVQACEKCMGLRPGEKIERICVIHILGVTVEPLGTMIDLPAYGAAEAEREGFPHMTGAEFVAMFMEHMRCDRDRKVTRIWFEFVD